MTSNSLLPSSLGAWTPLVNSATLVLPLVVTLLVIWAGLFQVEKACQAIGISKGNFSLPKARLAAHLWQKSRQMLLPILLPAGLMLLAQAVYGQFLLADLNPSSNHLPSQLSLPLALPALGLVIFLAPVLLREAWPTGRLVEGNLRTELEALFRQQNCHCRREPNTKHFACIDSVLVVDAQ